MDNYLRRRREELNLTLEEVADYVGVSTSTVSRWETGFIANMKRDKIARLSEILNIAPSKITGWETVKVENNGNIKDFVLRSEELELILELRKETPSTLEDIIKCMEKIKAIQDRAKYGDKV